MFSCEADGPEQPEQQVLDLMTHTGNLHLAVLFLTHFSQNPPNV